MSRGSPRSSAALALERRVTRIVNAYVKTFVIKVNAPRAQRAKRPDNRPLKVALDEFLREFVLGALERRRTGMRWNIKGTARDLEIDRGRLQRLIDRLGLRASPRPRRRVRRRRGG